MFQGINKAVNTNLNLPIGGNEQVREDPIWLLAKRNNRKERIVNKREHSGTYRPLPMV